MALSLVVLLPLRYAGWELMTRIYLFELPLVACLGAILLTTNKKVMIGLGLLVTIGSVLFLIPHYGNHIVDYWTPHYLAGYKFTQELRSSTNYKLVRPQDIYLNNNTEFRERLPTKSHHLAISQLDDNISTFLYNDPNFVDNVWEWLKNSPSYTSIYSNPEFEVFKWVQK